MNLVQKFKHLSNSNSILFLCKKNKQICFSHISHVFSDFFFFCISLLNQYYRCSLCLIIVINDNLISGSPFVCTSEQQAFPSVSLGNLCSNKPSRKGHSSWWRGSMWQSALWLMSPWTVQITKWAIFVFPLKRETIPKPLESSSPSQG